MKPPEEHIISLLEKHALGICSPEERKLLEQWYASFPENAPVWLHSAEKAALKEGMKAEIFNAITDTTIRRLPADNNTGVTAFRPRQRARRLFWPAAAILVLLSAALMFYIFSGREPDVLLTSVTAPAGKGLMLVQLPDQSEIWLEPGSRIRYAADFGETSRQVELEDGMAFFSVSRQTELPFTVNTPGGLQVKVLGTAFTVKAYRGLQDMQVSVTSGAIQVSDSTGVLGVLKADQQILYHQDTRKAIRSTGPEDDWRTGNMELNDAPFAEVARILENRYGLQVAFNNEDIARYRFNLRINRQAGAEEILEMLQDISGLDYTFENGRITVYGIKP